MHVVDRPGVADLAVEVADELQSMGIGSALVRHTVRRARDNGFALLTAATLWENRPARALLRRLEFRAHGSDGSEIELELELDPPSDGLESAPAIERTPPQTNPEEDIVSTIRATRRDQGDKLQQFASRAVDEVGATLNAALVVMGDKLGLHPARAAAGGLSSAELRMWSASRSGRRARSFRSPGLT